MVVNTPHPAHALKMVWIYLGEQVLIVNQNISYVPLKKYPTIYLYSSIRDTLSFPVCLRCLEFSSEGSIATELYCSNLKAFFPCCINNMCQ